MIWADVLREGRAALEDAGIEDADNDAWYLFESSFGMSRAEYLARTKEKAEYGCDPGLTRDYSAYKDRIARRAAHEPLQYILGTQDFCGLEFEVNNSVMIPRQDTETLVRAVLSRSRDKNIRILDLCTGSGCIAVSLKKLGGYAYVAASDISDEALDTAKRNCERLMVSDIGVDFRKSDLFSAFLPEEKFDIITANPPYIPTAVIDTLDPEVCDHEPRMALDGSSDGMYFYRRLAGECPGHLTPGGVIYFEIGYDQGEKVSSLLEDNGFAGIEIIKDLSGNDRVVTGIYE